MSHGGLALIRCGGECEAFCRRDRGDDLQIECRVARTGRCAVPFGQAATDGQSPTATSP
ncbi:MAG: hypothetical protein LBT05_00010 [Planctomycetaceae bacterium]|nr:hypothetical protein [Planctomycetaceae bacterium]